MSTILSRALAVVAFVLALPATQPQAQGTVSVAAASDLQTALPRLAAEFERATGITVEATFGSSGNFVAQIQNGAPFDIFFSADADYPRRLAAAGLVDADTLYEYANGRLVLWARTDTGLDVSTGLAILRDPRVRRIAIANPAVAPYGRAAVAALRSQGLYEAVQSKLVFAENVSQAAQFAQSGNADVAIVGHALALGDSLKSTGRFAEVPAASHPPIVQALAVVTASKRKDNARALLAFMKGPQAQQVLKSFGFDLPAAVR